MFGIGPTELALFLVILLLAVGPDRLPTFMRTVGKGLRQVRSASREFKEAIGLDELMREGDPFRAPPVRSPRARPVPVQEETPPPPPSAEAVKAASTTPPAVVTDESDPPPETNAAAEAERP
jgi:Sec-independent protein translocase protein TatA